MTDLLFKNKTYQIRGACFEVYKQKGFGFLESVYQEFLEIEFGLQGIPFEAQPRIRLDYNGHVLESEFVPDLICFGLIVVELKALSELNDKHRAQVHNYLKASAFRHGLLVNFCHFPNVEIERIVR